LETETFLLSIQSSVWDIQFQPVSTGAVICMVSLVLLLVFSALISGAEVAFFSLTAKEKKQLKKNRKTDVLVLKMLEIPEKLLSTILVANSFFNIAFIVLAVSLLSPLIGLQNKPALEFILQIVIILFVVILFGEILPKLYASYHKLRLVRLMSLPLQLLGKIFYPVGKLLSTFTIVVNQRIQRHSENFSMDDISMALKMKSEEEHVDEKEILEGIVKFGNKNVAEIMKSRVDVVSLDITNNFTTVLQVIVDSGFSRIPVYIDSFDNIKGILYIKDILPHSHKGNTFKWQSLVRPPFYVPETKKINSLLKEFQKNKVHLAIVIDEYGGTSGIVTLEDILEEIVGEIVDEFDEEENFFSKVAENIFLFDGKTLLGDFYKITKSNDDVFDEVKGDADTLAGLILELMGEIPSQDETVEYKQFVFTIEEVDDRRIIQIRVQIRPEAE